MLFWPKYFYPPRLVLVAPSDSRACQVRSMSTKLNLIMLGGLTHEIVQVSQGGRDILGNAESLVCGKWSRLEVVVGSMGFWEWGGKIGGV